MKVTAFVGYGRISRPRLALSSLASVMSDTLNMPTKPVSLQKKHLSDPNILQTHHIEKELKLQRKNGNPTWSQKTWNEWHTTTGVLKKLNQLHLFVVEDEICHMACMTRSRLRGLGRKFLCCPIKSKNGNRIKTGDTHRCTWANKKAGFEASPPLRSLTRCWFIVH